MKKAEDYIIERETDHWADQEYCKSDIINWIKQAQIDAIEETVKRCAENAEVNINGDCDDKFSLRSQNGEWLVIKPCVEKILNVAEQLKKGLQ